jgi:hypothetical protein
MCVKSIKTGDEKLLEECLDSNFKKRGWGRSWLNCLTIMTGTIGGEMYKWLFIFCLRMYHWYIYTFLTSLSMHFFLLHMKRCNIKGYITLLLLYCVCYQKTSNVMERYDRDFKNLYEDWPEIPLDIKVWEWKKRMDTKRVQGDWRGKVCPLGVEFAVYVVMIIC